MSKAGISPHHGPWLGARGAYVNCWRCAPALYRGQQVGYQAEALYLLRGFLQP